MAFKSLTGFDASSQNIVNVADPSSASHAATKAYVDSMVAGLRWKDPVRVASTATVTISNPGTAVFDTITLSNGDRILLKNQSTASENGIYIFNGSGSAMTRATDANTAAKLNSATVFVAEGSANADRGYTQTTEITTLGSDSVTWVQFNTGTAYSADGQGIELSGTTFSLELNGATLSKSASGLKVNDAYAGAGLAVSSDVLAVGAGDGITVNANDVALASTAAGNGLTYTTGVLAVGAGTGISVAADAVSVDTGVVARKYSTTIGNGSLTSIAVTHNLGTRAIVWQLYDSTSFADVVCDAVRTDTNTLTLTFAVAPTSGQYTVTVIG